MRSLRLGLEFLWRCVKTNKRLFWLGVIVSFLLIFYFPAVWPYIWRKPAHTVGIAGNYTLNSLPKLIQEKLSFGLVALQEDGNVKPAVAESWIIEESGKQLTLFLRPNLMWNDGTKLSSDQINFDLRGVDVSRPDAQSLKFSLNEPFAPLLSLLSQPLFKSNLVGLGENKIVQLRFNGRFLSTIRLKNINNQEEIEYKFFPTESELITALKLGSVREIIGLRNNALKNLPKNTKITEKVDGQTEAILFFNTQKKWFEEKTFRQGLVYALPDKFESGEKADSPLPRNSWANNSSVKKYRHNLDLAKNMVIKTASGSALPKIILATNKELEETAHIIADSWRKLGIEVIIEIASAPPMNFDAYLTYVALPADPDQYILWHSTQRGNISGYRSFKIDKLLEEGRQEIDQRKRKIIYSNFQKAITEDVPAAFLFYPKVYTVNR